MPNAWENVYQYLRDQITYGHLHPREKLDEKDISLRLKVSRTPIREAFKQLQAEGYITVVPKKGSFVTEYSPTELDQIYRILVKLEGLAVHMASMYLKPKDIEVLRHMNRRMKRFSENNAYKDFMEENVRFHTFFYDGARNNVLKDLISQLRKKVFRYRYLGITIPGNIALYVDDHEKIINSLRDGNSKLASKYMEAHIDRVRKILIDFYNRFS